MPYKNRDAFLAYQRQYSAERRESKRVAARARYAENAATLRAQCAAYKLNNRDTVNAAQRKLKSSLPDAYLACKLRIPVDAGTPELYAAKRIQILIKRQLKEINHG